MGGRFQPDGFLPLLHPSKKGYSGRRIFPGQKRQKDRLLEMSIEGIISMAEFKQRNG